ncbi:MAG: MBL fold metallo-hydrolase [Anaerolineales bacterium]|nr:MBL fold metallo-hydrolase [Anaerolineales bacterium]
MKIHHLNCGTMHPFGLPRKDGTGGFFLRGDGVLHCLLVETSEGLALVDAGWGLRDCGDPTPAVRQFMALCSCARDPEETAVRQIKKLGAKPSDVKHIFLTHMHLDHAGALPDFPQAAIHLAGAELEACLRPRTYMERYAYRPEHWAHSPRWQAHETCGARWFDFDCAPPIRIGGADFVLIPFPGHTRGHCAVAVRGEGGWLLHCGDLYGYQPQVSPAQPYRYPNGALMERIVTAGFAMPRRHWKKIRQLLREHGGDVRAFCSHDAVNFPPYIPHEAPGEFP